MAPEMPILLAFPGAVYHSNSSADNVNWLFFSAFLRLYYPYSSKNALVFVPVQIFRAKIEPVKII